METHWSRVSCAVSTSWAVLMELSIQNWDGHLFHVSYFFKLSTHSFEGITQVTETQVKTILQTDSCPDKCENLNLFLENYNFKEKMTSKVITSPSRPIAMREME